MTVRISKQEISAVYKSALARKLVNDEDTAVIFYDLTFLKERINKLISSFPQSALHASAIKANPLLSILKFINDMNVGVEAASLPELYLSEKAGFPSSKVVFDSPAKTISELRYAVEKGYYINADSLEELELIDDMLKKTNTNVKAGIRINPQVGTGSIAITSVAGEYSKFGVPVKYKRNEIIEAYKKYNWLTGIHLHIGSQGISLDMLLKGIGIIYELAEEINNGIAKTNTRNKISYFDIGGGLPVQYNNNAEPVLINDYADKIKTAFPKLFNGDYNLITEFGRYIHANSGWTVSRIEYVKKDKNINTAVIHLGADMFLRKSYNPELWYHEITVIDKNGNLKPDTKKESYNIAGPLCFAGDFIEKNISLPELSKGDNIIIHDTGAYTLSMWSRYNSRQMPKVIGYYNKGEEFVILKQREKPENLIEFWG